MKIDGYCSRELEELNFRLDSVDLKFQWYVQPQYDSVPSFSKSDKDNRAYIEFRDTREIEQLITMLQRFKDESQRRFGRYIYNSQLIGFTKETVNGSEEE